MSGGRCPGGLRRFADEPGCFADKRGGKEYLACTTQDIYCYLWVTAVFQSCVREHYRGWPIVDTLNNPALFRFQQ